LISFIRRAFRLIDRPARVRFALFAVGSVVIAALEALALALMLPLTQLLLENREQAPLPQAARFVGRLFGVETRLQVAAVLGVIVVAAFVVKGVAAILLLRWAVDNSLQQEARIARKLFSRYLTAPTSFHLSTNSAEIQRTLNESLLLVFRRTVPFVMGAAADMFTLVAIAVVIVVNDAGVAVIAIVYFAVVGLVYQRYIGGSQKVAAKRAHKEIAQRYQQVQEAVRAKREISVLHREDYFVDRFYETKLELADAQQLLIFYQLLPRYFLDLAFVLGAGLMVGYTFAVLGPTEGLATTGVFLTAGFRLIAPLNRIMSTVTLARTADPHVDQVIADVTLLDSLQEQRTDVPAGRLGPSVLELDGVRYRYDGTDVDVLDGVSMRVEPGEDVGIVGTTGAGKTTLLNIVLGLLDPTGGEIRIAGRPLPVCRTDWQLSLGYVPQEIVLIDDDIRANVVFGVTRGEIDDDRLHEVLAMVQMDEFVRSLPQGLDTGVGELGVRLSGGQRQRLGLARALYQEPSVLVLDEATSALDSETESRIMERLEAMGRALTILTVSHRLSTLKHCDRIYFLRDGRIAAVGTFDELNASEPEFAQLVARAQLAVATPPPEPALPEGNGRRQPARRAARLR
jgi:ATP-binding cassette, subfamily B, bacterial PglK